MNKRNLRCKTLECENLITKNVTTTDVVTANVNGSAYSGGGGGPALVSSLVADDVTIAVANAGAMNSGNIVFSKGVLFQLASDFYQLNLILTFDQDPVTETVATIDFVLNGYAATWWCGNAVAECNITPATTRVHYPCNVISPGSIQYSGRIKSPRITETVTGFLYITAFFSTDATLE